MAAGDDHRARAQVAACRCAARRASSSQEIALGRRLQVHRHVELLERLLAQLLDEVLGQHSRVAGHVEDPLLRIQRGELAAELGQRVDDARAGLAHAGPEGRATGPTGPGADDRDVADLVEVGVDAHGVRDCRVGDGSPSSAFSARSTRGGDAGEARRVALGVGRGLGRAQALHEVEERAGVVGLERDDELLVVEPERVGRVVVDRAGTRGRRGCAPA